MEKSERQNASTKTEFIYRNRKRRLPMISATSDILFTLSCFILVTFTVGGMIVELMVEKIKEWSNNNENY